VAEAAATLPGALAPADESVQADATKLALGPLLSLPPSTAAKQLNVLIKTLLKDQMRHAHSTMSKVQLEMEDQEIEAGAFGFSLGGIRMAEGESLAALVARAKVEASAEVTLPLTFHRVARFRVAPVARCSVTLQGHEGPVLSAHFDARGTELATGSGDGTIRLWDLDTQTPKGALRGHKGWILAVAWSPDGVYMVSGASDGEVRIWNPERRVCLGGALRHHKQAITGVAWEPAMDAWPSRRFVTSSKDKTARVFDAKTARYLFALTGHGQSVTAVRWGGGNLIYTASQDMTVRVWSSVDGTPVRTCKGHANWVNCIALNTDTALRRGPYDHFGKPVVPGDGSPAHLQQAATVAYQRARSSTPDSERLASASDDSTIFLWAPQRSETPLARLTGHQQLINCVAFSPDGRILASASFDKAVKLWAADTGAFIASLRGHVQAVYQLAWSPDSRLLASSSRDAMIKCWSVEKKEVVRQLDGHSDEVYALDWSPDGVSLASGSKDKSVKVWRR
jgi:ribosome assembly protein 4